MMKISLSISPDTPPRAPIVYKGNLPIGIKKAAEFGYDAIELHVHRLHELNCTQIKDIMRTTNLAVSAVSPGLVYGGDTFSFSNPDAAIQQQALDRVKLQIDVCSQLNAVALVGLVHGNLSQDVYERKLEYDRICNNFVQIDAYALSKSTTLAIEAINRYETNCFNRADEVVELITNAGLRSSGVLLDTFHMNIEEKSIEAAIKTTGKNLCYFHIPDSNRCYPGSGHLNIHSIIGALREIDYQGYLALEVLPLPAADKAAQNGILFLRELLE